MKEQIEDVKGILRKLPHVGGCITGSSMIGYWEGQDVDLFTYSKESFLEVMYFMIYDPRFQMLDPLEKWKLEQVRDKGVDAGKFGVLTIKFMYNTCVPINIVFKNHTYNAASVLSSFDLDIICIAEDIQSGKILDMSEGLPDKVATWNKWNTSYDSSNIWELSKILRQLQRCFKYHSRGYNTDLAVEKYIEIIDKLINYDNVFNNDKFAERLKDTKENMVILKKICLHWLENHEISEEALVTLQTKIKEI